MSNGDYSNILSKMDENHQKEIIRTYRGFASHAFQIYTESNKLIVNWIFALNTGGLASNIYAIQTSVSNQAYLLKISALFFLLGIIAIAISIYSERYKFDKRGQEIESLFKKLNDSEITGERFLKDLFSYEGSKMPWYFELAGATLFIFGSVCCIGIYVFGI